MVNQTMIGIPHSWIVIMNEFDENELLYLGLFLIGITISLTFILYIGDI